MIRLASVIDTFAADFRTQYGSQLSSAHLQALAAMRRCRTQASAKMQVRCTGCAHQTLVPHSCGFSPLPALPAPREPTVAGTATQAAGACPVFSGHVHVAGGVAAAGLGASAGGLRPVAALRLGDAKHVQPQRPATAGHARRHRGIAYQYAPAGVPPACPFRRAGSGLGQAAPADPVYLLWRGDEDRTDTNRCDDRRRTRRTACCRGRMLIM